MRNEYAGSPFDINRRLRGYVANFKSSTRCRNEAEEERVEKSKTRACF